MSPCLRLQHPLVLPEFLLDLGSHLIARHQSYRDIARRVKTSAPTIARWKMRFEQDGMAGLEGRHQGRKPRAATPAAQARVAAANAAETGGRQYALVLLETGE